MRAHRDTPGRLPLLAAAATLAVSPLGPPRGPPPAAAQETEEGPRAGDGRDGAEARQRAGGPGTRVLRALAVGERAPTLDGRLDDPAWQGAEVARDFVQLRPHPGAPASQPTEVRVLFSSEAVFVGARMFDSAPDSVIARLARRDEPAVTDRFLVAFDSYHDRRTAFAFGVSAAGAREDHLLYDDTEEDTSWDAVWEAATRVDSLGWTAEFRIPLSQLRFSRPTGEDAVWGVNFQRVIARLEETSLWSPLPADRSRTVSAFGELVGLAGIRPGRNLELRPYTAVRATRAPGEAADPFHRATALATSVGGDLKYGITPNLTLNLAVNPDFGQVEADPSVVNLTAFETFFPEKRPFFQEGADIFRFSIGLGDDEQEQLFYSRRIGRAPRGNAPGSAVFAEAPEATTILAAAKLSGKTADGWSVGLLSALTAEERARYVEPGGEVAELPVEPLANHAVGRVVRNFRGGESAVGAIVTAVHRAGGAGSSADLLPGAAYAGGVDFRHRFGSGHYRVRGWLLGSHFRGSEEAIGLLQGSPAHYFQRPDAPHLALDPSRTALSGAAANLEVARVGGGSWRWAFLGHLRSPGFDVNALGFQRRADQAIAAGYAGYDRFRPGGIFRRWRVNLNGWSAWTLGGERIVTGGNLNGNFQLRNYWGGYGGLGYALAGLSPTSLRGGPALRTPGTLSAWFGFFSDSRKAVRLSLGGNFGVESGTETRRLGLSPTLTLRPSSRAELSLGPRVAWDRNDWQYVAAATAGGEVRYIFGRLEQRTAALTARLNYTFTPDLSLQLYAQPFLSAGGYDRYTEVAEPRAAEFGTRFHGYGDSQVTSSQEMVSVDRDGDGVADLSFGRPDFNIRDLRSNLVLRWQYRPGSTVFLVWSQDRSAFARDGSLRLRRDLGELFGAPGRNVFLAKVEHWLGF